MRGFNGVAALGRAVVHELLPGRPRFATRDVVIGRNVSFGRNVVINARRIRIGDGVRIDNDVRIDSDVFEIGDFGTIYQGCFFPGPGELRIGHNFWLGAASIVDAKGGTHIGNNVGVGAHSQLWTHMVHGDVMAGCRFHNASPLHVEEDAWLVGHCLVSPVRIGARALVLLGSVVTKDVPSDRTYAGVPAADVTDRLGPQFAPKTPAERERYLRDRLAAFARERGVPNIEQRVTIVTSAEDLRRVPDDRIGFDVAGRTYTKRGTALDMALMRFLLPDAKFVPLSE